MSESKRQANKYDQGKPMMRFLTKEFLEATAKAQTYGANKYGPWNFQKGLETSALYDAAIRHLLAWYSGENNDPESLESHLGHCAANLNMLLWMLANKPEMDDRPNKIDPELDQKSLYEQAKEIQKRGR